ncbi:DUF6089 family protein [Emticicia sp. 21SJ11W-3]|uniref:type IX secretion system protein PorG n=1 Tax=Emticicia sp. 21SJ11W-3 TaxID=2916755 RepID=UPI00209CCE0D|nr:DUF6089 family protein [Emticicia sp. 21SJ11W-3]UTA68124.1 porin family protein [Emticicia sp. 21SJ11W-3]
MKKSLVLVILIAALPKLHAQIFEIGAGVGGLNYKGDVLPKYKPFVVDPGANLFGRMNISRSISLKANVVAGRVHANDSDMDDVYHRTRGFNFNARILEMGGQIEYNFLNFRTSSSRNATNWSPYVFGGAAFTIRSTNYNIRSYSDILLPSFYYTSGYSDTRTNAWILGIGFKKELSPHWNWGMEFGTRWINDDFVDGLGYNKDGVYNTNLNTGIDDIVKYNLKTQVPGTRTKDMYYYTNFSISYVFYKIYCPPVRR